MFIYQKINIFDFDIFSRRISFYFNTKEKIGSLFGFILTIVYIISTIVLFAFYCLKVIKREEMRIHDSTMYSQNLPSININPNLLYFAFGLEDPVNYNRYIDETIYYPIIYFIKMEKENGSLITKEKITIKPERCNVKQFGEKYQSLFVKDELNNSYCLPNFNFTLAGGFKYDKFSYIRIKIKPCTNTTENKYHCKPQNMIDTYLTSTYFSILVKDIGLNPLNYSMPIIPILQDLYTTIDKSITRDFLIYVGITEVQTDTGLLSTDIKSEFYLQFRQYHDPFFFRDIEEYHSGKDIFTVQIRLEEYIKIHKRTYTKISEIFSLIGGYMQLLYTIFGLITTLTKNINIEKKLLNSIFNFNIKKRKIILSIHYEKRLNYLIHSNKGDLNSFISFIAKKSLKPYKKNTFLKQNNFNQIHQKEDLLFINKNNSFLPLIKKSISGSVQIKREIGKKMKNFSEKGIKSNHRSSKHNKYLNLEQNLNKSKLSMIFKDEDNDFQNNASYFKKSRKSSHNYTKNSTDLKRENNNENESIDEVRVSLFDYFCHFGNIENKRDDIKLFNSAVNFYRNQMNIIHFFNVIFLTEIMLNHHSKKNNLLNQFIEIPLEHEHENN